MEAHEGLPIGKPGDPHYRPVLRPGRGPIPASGFQRSPPILAGCPSSSAVPGARSAECSFVNPTISLVAVATEALKSGLIKQHHIARAVTDQATAFKELCRTGHTFAPNAQHEGQRTVRDEQLARLGPVAVHQQAARQTLLDRMVLDAGDLLCQLALAHKRQAAHVVMEVLAEYEVRTTDAPTRQAFLIPELQARITEAVQERLPPVQLSVLTGVDAPPTMDLADVVRRTVDVVVKQTIDIPPIAVVPKGVVTSGFKPFTLDVKGLHLQPKDRALVGQTLRTHEQFTYTAQAGRAERRLEDYIVHALIDYDDID